MQRAAAAPATRTVLSAQLCLPGQEELCFHFQQRSPETARSTGQLQSLAALLRAVDCYLIANSSNTPKIEASWIKPHAQKLVALGFPACRIAGFLTCEAFDHPPALENSHGSPTGKSAIRQAGKPALRRLLHARSSMRELACSVGRFAGKDVVHFRSLPVRPMGTTRVSQSPGARAVPVENWGLASKRPGLNTRLGPVRPCLPAALRARAFDTHRAWRR